MKCRWCCAHGDSQELWRDELCATTRHVFAVILKAMRGPVGSLKGVPMKKMFIAILLTVFASPSFAQEAPKLLVSVPALAQELKDPKLVLLEFSSKNLPDAQHIPGTQVAVLADFATPMGAEKGPLMLELLPVDVLRAKLEALGVSDNSHIVVYDDGESATSFRLTTRLIFTLEYLGLGNHTALLNGGLKPWEKAGMPTTTTVAAAKPGHLRVRETEPIVADAKLVSSIGTMPGYKLVDARAVEFYDGKTPSMGEAGHIPGAVNIPSTEVVDSDGMVDVAKLAVIFRDAGIKPGDTVVNYCHIGAQATATMFAERLLGNPVLLYDGSWQDWVLNHRGPIVK
jgi:thiosulfate/3-mercaptopyruvate sulfurtransferase